MKDYKIGNERFLGTMEENEEGEKVITGVSVSGVPTQNDVERFVRASNVGRLTVVSFSGPTSVATKELKPQVARHIEVCGVVLRDVEEIHLKQHLNYKFGKAMGRVADGAGDIEEDF